MRKALVGVGVLLLLLLVADRVGKEVAERVLADQVDAELSTRPDVRIGGFPFLTQALSGTYDEIEISGTGLRQPIAAVTSFRAVLEGAQVPLSDALGGNVSAVPVDRVAGTVVLGLSEVAAETGQDVRIEAEGDRLRVSGTIALAGQQLAVSALSEVVLDGETLAIRAEEIQINGEVGSGPVLDAARDLLDLQVPLAGLPYDLRLTDVTVSGDGLRVSAAARGVRLTR